MELCQSGAVACRQRLLLEGNSCEVLLLGDTYHLLQFTIYNIYILINPALGKQSLEGYFCQCIQGRRTLQSYARTISIVLTWARYQVAFKQPAPFLDETTISIDEAIRRRVITNISSLSILHLILDSYTKKQQTRYFLVHIFSLNPRPVALFCSSSIVKFPYVTIMFFLYYIYTLLC